MASPKAASGVSHAARWANALVGVLLAVVALHILLVLFTGGYMFSISGIAVTGREVKPATILLLALVILHFPLAQRSLSWRVFLSHRGTILFSGLFMVYLAAGALGAGDSIPARYLPLSILREGNFDLDEFPFLYARGIPAYLRHVNGHYVSDYPIGAALLALPFYLPSALGPVSPEGRLPADLEKISAGSIVALSAVVLYGVLRQRTTLRMALLIATIYALGSSSLSVSSQALWQHGPSQLALTLTLYSLVRARQESRWTAPAGFFLAFAAMCRPTDLLIALPLGVYVLRHHRPNLAGFVCSGLPPVLFQLWYNSTYFGDPLRTQFLLLGSWTTSMGEGITGILLSPGRGLFVYSPIFLFAVVQMACSWRKDGDPLLRYLGVGVFLVILLYSKWADWAGGTSYGPRLLADLTPILAFSLYPLADRLDRSRAFKGAFVAAAILSIGAHSIGAFLDEGSWHEPSSSDPYRQRLWSWTDNQLVNPPRIALDRALILLRGLPTSRTSPELLSALYRVNLPPTVSATAAKPLHVVLQATNEGRAVWLSPLRRMGGTGVVALEWRWHGERGIPGVSRSVPIRYDIFPRRSYEFRVSVDTPQEHGTYRLELDLVSDRVASFSGRGVPPIRLTVKVDPPQTPERAASAAR